LFQSILVPHSYGIAAENLSLTDDKDTNTKGKIAYKPNRYLEVTLIEALPFYHGDINSDTTTFNSKYESKSGSVKDEEVETSLSVKAKWLPRGQGNRITPPNIRRGERLLIHRLGNTDQYFWEEIESDNHLRKLETVIWIFSATKNEKDSIDIDSCYTLEVSTHSKRIRLTTSSANEEPYKYVIDLDTAFGSLTIKDDIDNVIKLESKPKRILLKNGDNSLLHILDKRLHLHADEEVLITTNKYTLQAKDKIIEETTTKTTGASGSITNTTPQITDDAKVTVTGTVLHQSMTTLNGLLGL
jgi:hypothetical protein